MRNFRHWNIWKDSIRFVTDSYILAYDFPVTEKYGIISQIPKYMTKNHNTPEVLSSHY